MRPLFVTIKKPVWFSLLARGLIRHKCITHTNRNTLLDSQVTKSIRVCYVLSPVSLMDSKYSKRKGLGVFVQTAQNEFLSFVPLYNLYFGCLVNLLQVSPPKISD